MIDPAIMDIIVPLTTAVTAGGGAFFGLKASLNGTKGRVERIDNVVGRIESTVIDSNTRLAVLEARHDHLQKEVESLQFDCKVNHG